jgi:HEAT repeat protein
MNNDLKNKSIQELYDDAYPLFNDEYLKVIYELQSRSNYSDFQFNIKKAKDPDPVIREIAINTLEQIGFDRDLSAEEREAIDCAILSNLNTDNESLLESTIAAAGRRRTSKAIEYFGIHAEHRNPIIREAVAVALGFCDDDERSINLLIHLSKDPVDDVRDWATFGLGSQVSISTNEIIQALIERVNEQNLAVASEAIIGLAKREYPGCDTWILERLESDHINILLIDACIIVKCKKFLPRLKYWNSITNDGDEKLLKSAINQAILECSK